MSKPDMNTAMEFVTALKEGGLKSLILVGGPGMGMVTRTREVMGDPPVFDLNQVQDILGLIALHKFLSENADRKVLIDAADYFTRNITDAVGIETRNTVSMILKQAADFFGKVSHLAALDGFTFKGAMVITCFEEQDHYIWRPIRDRSIVVNL